MPWCWDCSCGRCLRRYSGYCAWRGVVTDEEAPAAAQAARQAYPELGTAIYFEIARRTHGVLYELPNQRLNWLWRAPPPHAHCSTIFSARAFWCCDGVACMAAGAGTTCQITGWDEP